MNRILIALLSLALIGGGIAYYLFTKKVASTQDLKAEVSVKMEDLYAEFAKDEKAAFEKYKDKVMEISGVVKSKSEADKDHAALTLGNEAMAGTIGITLEPSESQKAAAIQSGAKVLVKGICTGIQSAGDGSGEPSMLDDLGKEVQFKKGIILVTTQ